MEKSKPIKKVVVGVVVSDKMDKTIVVRKEMHKRHPIYKKFFKEYRKVKAHDEKNEAETGDLVRVEETRPISKDKYWRLVKIIEKAEKG